MGGSQAAQPARVDQRWAVSLAGKAPELEAWRAHLPDCGNPYVTQETIKGQEFHVLRSDDLQGAQSPEEAWNIAGELFARLTVAMKICGMPAAVSLDKVLEF